MKKANEIAVSCGVDVAFIAFSPSGRVSKFSNQTRIEDVIERYANLPAESRSNHISNFQEKMEKLRQFGHIKGDMNKIYYLDNQDYEPGPEQEPSLHQLCWYERNLTNSLQRVFAKKNELESQAKIQSICPYSASVRESILQDLVDGAKYAANENLATPNIPNFSISSNLCDFASLHNPLEVTSSGVTHMSNQSLCNIKGPRFASAKSVTTKASSMNENSMLHTNSNSRQLNTTEGQEIGKINMESISMDTSDESQAPRHHKENFRDTLFDDILKEDTLEDNMFWTSKIRRSNLWEWEDLLLDNSFNL
ncbi:hypothetical protein ABFX02_12G009900 [Erythranthe guttata]